RPAALGQYVHEGLVVIGRGERRSQVGEGGRRTGGAGGQDPARHRGQRRREREGHGEGGGNTTPFGRKVLLYLWRVPVRAPDLVRGHRPHDLGSEQVGPGRAARARGAGGGHDDDVGRVGKPGRQQRGQRENGRGGVAAGGGHGGGGPDRVPRAGQFGQAVGPLPGVRARVVLRPLVRVGQPEVGAQVDDLEVAGQARGQLRRLPVRERREQQVGVGQEVRLGGREDRAVQAGMPGELRVRRGHGGTGAVVRGQRSQLKVGMAG